MCVAEGCSGGAAADTREEADVVEVEVEAELVEAKDVQWAVVEAVEVVAVVEHEEDLVDEGAGWLGPGPCPWARAARRSDPRGGGATRNEIC